jgi:predicted DNA-binding protein (UPF0251 family)
VLRTVDPSSRPVWGPVAEFGGTGVYAVHDWAEVHRLHHVEGMSKQQVAAKLGMSRTTVYRLLSQCYVR